MLIAHGECMYPHAGLSSCDTLNGGVSKETEMRFYMSLKHTADSFFIQGRYLKNSFMLMQSEGVSLQVTEPVASLNTFMQLLVTHSHTHTFVPIHYKLLQDILPIQ